MSERLIDYLRRNYGDAHSARALKRMIDQGWCRVNDCVERHSTRKLRPSDCVTLHIQTAASKTRSWETGRVLFEDDHLVIYNKPAGISSDGATGLEAFAQERQLILLNRLDKDTTG
ncbi:MAG: hypothetical protein KDK78_09400, partial [Chlamydiia bacterium]|nr:hypothetical protein [Chlamydiia bacterium]